MDKFDLRINQINDLDEVLRVAEEVFQPNEQEREKYHKKSDWEARIKDGLLVTVAIENKIVGFAISYKKDRDLHIWNVGVLAEHRKNGIWKTIYAEIVKFAKENDYQKVSLNTYKDKFPGMYTFCTKSGFTEYKTEVDPLSGLTKSMFKKDLS